MPCEAQHDLAAPPLSLIWPSWRFIPPAYMQQHCVATNLGRDRYWETVKIRGPPPLGAEQTESPLGRSGEHRLNDRQRSEQRRSQQSNRMSGFGASPPLGAAATNDEVCPLAAVEGATEQRRGRVVSGPWPIRASIARWC
jgi:hypothetical protein